MTDEELKDVIRNIESTTGYAFYKQIFETCEKAKKVLAHREAQRCALEGKDVRIQTNHNA